MLAAHLVRPDQLARLAATPHRIRNICVVAHVDHGKTSLTDSLIASNGLVPERSAGRVRYMDSTYVCTVAGWLACTLRCCGPPGCRLQTLFRGLPVELASVPRGVGVWVVCVCLGALRSDSQYPSVSCAFRLCTCCCAWCVVCTRGSKEEQLRGITMKSSSITLLHLDVPYRKLRDAGPGTAAAAGAAAAGAAAAGAGASGGASASPPSSSPTAAGTAPSTKSADDNVHYIINLIDSPGHVDFSRYVCVREGAGLPWGCVVAWVAPVPKGWCDCGGGCGVGCAQ